MILSNLSRLDLPVFAGQGTAAVNTPQTRQQARLDASTTSGSFLLSACYDAFYAELSSLSSVELDDLDVDLRDFESKESLLAVPKDRYLNNAILSGPTLFLIQSLRYLAFVEASGLSTGSLTPFSDVLKTNSDHGIGILGFSSGILPACVVATSSSSVTYIARAVEAYRLSIWIGIRTQIFRRAVLDRASIDKDTFIPWSLVFLGMSQSDAEECIQKFNQQTQTSFLYLTAITDATCVTISGRPDLLSTFAANLASQYVVHKTSLETLYHAPIHVDGVRTQVMADVHGRNIQFPNFSDLKVPVRSTSTGNAITKDETTGTLLECILDMVLTQPVHWAQTVERLAASVGDVDVRLLNMGPGNGLIRSVERAFPRGRVSIEDQSAGKVALTQSTNVKQEPIAIIGMAVNMPGARNTSELWKVLEEGINTVAEIPGHRFNVSDYTNGKSSKRSMKAHTGNFIDGADEFDNVFFKISPREAKSMDPQQRVLLHTAYEALEDAGYVPNATSTFRPETFGCYIGVATHDYLQNLRNDIDVYYSTGTLKAFLSGRISYATQMSGPSIVVDTACSSSNVALYQGARALMNHDCDAAMVGGVNIISSPDMFLGLDRAHFLSPTGQCRAFDASADGYSRSEGCGIFIIKRLSDALAENDRILGVIRGIEVNQSGLAHSITHPHAPTQATLFEQILKNSGIDPGRVNVVEAHGTGTQAGDPTELESIRSIFAVNRSLDNPLHITSIKANIGHLEAASGAAGLAKLLLMLKHKTIPRQISLHNLNPRIAPLNSDNTVIDTIQTPWFPSHTDRPRVALLNNFGAAGSNAVLLLEEHIGTASSDRAHDGMSFVFGFSAKLHTAAEELRTRYLEFLRSTESEGIALSDIAYTSTARRQIYEHRVAISASNRSELIDRLEKAPVIRVMEANAKVVFVFSGQGSQYLGMGSSLYRTSSLFRKHIDECHDILTGYGFPGVRQIVLAGESSNLSLLQEFEAYQAAIFALEYALAKLWMSWGLYPAAVVGHSLGEYAALVIAEVLSLQGALTLIANRAHFMLKKCALNTTGMIAVNQSSTSLQSIISGSEQFNALSIACYNSAVDCVVSGGLVQLEAFKAHLDAEVKCKNVLLSVPFGYHSSAMAPLLEDLTSVATQITIRPPVIPVVSNVLGSVVPPGDASVFNAHYFARHCAEPVQFDSGIRALMASTTFASMAAWLEIGPHTTILPMLKANPSIPKDSLLLGSLRKQQDSWTTLTSSLAQLYVSGIDIHWRNVFSHVESVSCISLPSYPFVRTKFWIPFKENEVSDAVANANVEAAKQDLVSGFSMLHAWVQRPSKSNGCTAILETPITKLASAIRGHSVGGSPLCPASVYIEQALAGIALTARELGMELSEMHAELRKLEIAKPLVYDPAIERAVFTTITMHDGCGVFSVGSKVQSSSEESIHVHGQFRLQSNLQRSTKFSRTLPVITRHYNAVLNPAHGQMPEVFSTRTAYEVIFPRVVDYSKEYHTMQTLTVDPSGMEGCARVRLPSDYDRGSYVVHPIFMDTLLHVAGFIANMQGGPNDAYICSEVGSVKVIPELVDNDASYIVYCNNAWLPEDNVVLAEAYAVQLAEPRKIVAHLKGALFRQVRLDRLKRSLVHAAGGKKVKFSFSRTSSSSSYQSSSPEISFDNGLARSKRTPDIHTVILDIVSETCGIKATSLDSTKDLGDLGVDSLMLIEILGKLEIAFPDADLSVNALAFCKSIADIEKEVAARLDYSRASSGSETHINSNSGASSPRTLVTDDKLPEPTTLTVDDVPDVKQILASILDIDVSSMADDTELESLGLDSLTSIEALHALKSQFGLDLPGDFFTRFPTARSIQSYFSIQGPENVEPPVKKSLKTSDTGKLVRGLRLDINPVPIQQAHPGKSPLFLIHDGSGLINYYHRLSPIERAVWGIQNPHFARSQPWDDIRHMAAAYSQFILSQAATGPLIVGGWSFGGVVAYETARQLMRAGSQVQGIILIDSPSPINHVPLSDALIDTVLSLDSRGNDGSELARLMKGQFSMNARMLGDYDPEPIAACPSIVLLRSKDGFQPSGLSDVPTWLADRSDPRSAVAGWERLTGREIKVIDIPGNHFQPFQPSNIGEVSIQIADACRHFEELGS